MKILKSIFLLSLFAMITFSSCTKENEGETIVTPPEVEVTETTNNVLVGEISGRSNGEELDLGCFSIETPFELNINGDIISIDTYEDLELAVEGLEDQDSISVDFVYPLNVTYSDGESGIINNGEELGQAFASCVPDGGWSEGGFPAYLICDVNSCFQIVYPLTLVNSQGEEFIANDEEEFIELITENPILFFNFPLTLLDQEEMEVIVENDEELFSLLTECTDINLPTDSTGIDIDFGLGNIACYEIGYPSVIQVINADGEIVDVTVENEDELTSLFLEGNVVNFGTPMTLIDEEGQSITVNNEEEFIEALMECDNTFVIGEELQFILAFFAIPETPDQGCYSINYPVTLTKDGNEIEVNNFEEAFFEITEGANLGYPVEITQDNEILNIESFEELVLLVEGC